MSGYCQLEVCTALFHSMLEPLPFASLTPHPTLLLQLPPHQHHTTRRLCLTYNLRLTGPGPSPSSSSLPHTKAHQVSRLVSLMQQWQEDPQAPPFLAYVLEHKCVVLLS